MYLGGAVEKGVLATLRLRVGLALGVRVEVGCRHTHGGLRQHRLVILALALALAVVLALAVAVALAILVGIVAVVGEVAGRRSAVLLAVALALRVLVLVHAAQLALGQQEADFVLRGCAGRAVLGEGRGGKSASLRVRVPSERRSGRHSLGATTSNHLIARAPH